MSTLQASDWLSLTARCLSVCSQVVVPRLSTNGLRWQCSGDFVARQCLQYRGVLPVCADPSLGSPDGAILRAALQEVRPQGGRGLQGSHLQCMGGGGASLASGLQTCSAAGGTVVLYKPSRQRDTPDVTVSAVQTISGFPRYAIAVQQPAGCQQDKQNGDQWDVQPA